MKLLYPILPLMLFGPAYAERVLTPMEHQQAIQVQPNDVIVVKLPAAPSTGYQWFFDAPSSQAVKLVEPARFTPWQKHVFESSGDKTWRFVAQRPGEATLLFSYRLIKKDAPLTPLDTRSYKIVVLSKNNG